MLRRYLSEDAKINRRDFFTVLVLVFNALTWYYMTLLIFNNLSAILDITIPLAAYYLSAFISSIIGSILSIKILRVKFLQFWMFLGVIATLSPIVFGSEAIAMNVLLTSSILGVSFGLGMPSCFAYFTEHTLVENRGRISGIIFLTTILGVLPFSVFFRIFDFSTNLIIIATWRGLGLCLFLLLKPTSITVKTKKTTSLVSVSKNKSFLLYLTAWIMFSFIDRLEDHILRQFFGLDFHRFTRMAEPIIGGISAFFAGILADIVGRKRVVIYGFIALGLAYAILGITPTLLISWYFYIIIDGIAAGFLFVTFVFIIWGDLGETKNIEKYYALGSIPFFLSSLVPLFLTFYISQIPFYAAFSLASFFLFLAVLPLMYAPETLPEKKIQLRRLRGYVEAAKKIREKHTKRVNKD